MHQLTETMKRLGYLQEMPNQNQDIATTTPAMVTVQVTAALDLIERLSQAISNLEARLAPVLSSSHMPPSAAQQENPSCDPPLVASVASLLSQLQSLWYFIDDITDRVRI